MTSHTYQLPNGAERSKEAHESAMEVFPGGVSHNIRFYSPHPIYVDRAEGAHLIDVDGNEYVDFWMNHLASVLGHNYPEVVDAVQEQADNGLHYGTVNEKSLQLGKKIQEFVPTAERVRFCASGTEATMYAVRLARAETGHNHILKARGGWHGGNTDLAKAVHGPYDKPETVGLPPGVEEHIHGFTVNDQESITELLAEYGDDLAAIIIEPMLLAGGGIKATDDFLRFLREETVRRDSLLIFDEVVTGFRFSPGSYQARVDIEPDLTTLGKFLGGGLPVGAIVGRADLFASATPEYDGPDPVLAGGGTFSMNPMTATAGLESLEVLDQEPVYEYTETQAERILTELQAVFEDLGIDATPLGDSSLFIHHFEPEGSLESVEDVEQRTNRKALKTFHKRLFDHGYFFLPGHMGGISYQTTEDQLDGLVNAAEDVARDLQSEGVL